MDNARDFASRLVELLRNERAAMADFLVALAEFDERKLWIRLGYSGLFHFLHRELGMSKGAAHYRKIAAELIQRVPAIVEPLRDGRLCITSIIELAKVLTPANQKETLPRFFHCSRQEAKAVSAELSPADAVPTRTVVTALPPPSEVRPAPSPDSAAAVQLVERQVPAADAPGTFSVRHVGAEVQPVELAPVPTQPVAPTTRVVPLTADARRLHVTVTKRFLEKLEVAREALSHSHPGADAEGILEAGLDLLIERAARRKGIVARPRAQKHVTAPPEIARRAMPSRAIAAAVKREVWIRDEGRCQWPVAGGGVCGSTHRLQLDHVVPVGRGGAATVDNLRLCCAFHNDLAARQVYGADWMDQFKRAPEGNGREPRRAEQAG